MRTFIFFTLLALLGLASARSTYDRNDVTCEDILAAPVCAKLRAAAEAMKLDVELVDKLVRDAVSHGITKTKEIIAHVREEIIKAAKDFKCTTVLTKEACDHIEKVAEHFKIKMAEVVKVMKQIVSKGITSLKEIIEELKKHFFPGTAMELGITCETVLAKDVCEKLRKVAHDLKIKVEMIDQIIRQLVEEKITDAKRIIALVKAKLADLAKNFKCSWVLNEKVCAKIYEILAEIKVKAQVVDQFIKKLVVKGVKTLQKIIEEIKKHFFPGMKGELLIESELAIKITCEDILSEKACKTLKEAAEKLKVKAAEVDRIVQEAVAKGIKKASAIIKLVRAKIVELATNFKCEDALSAKTCAKIEELAKVVGVKMAEVEKVMKEVIAKGITKMKEILDELKKHFFPGMQGKIVNAVVCEDVLSEKVCKSLRDAAKKLKVKVELIDQLVREAVKEGITKASEIIKHVQEKIIEFATDFKCEDALSKKICDKIHKVADLIGVKYAKVIAKMKEIIAEGKTTAKAIIEAIKKFFFPDHALMIDNAVTCEDVLSEKVCKSLRDAAAKLKVKVELIDQLVREAVKEGITKASEIIKHVQEKMIELATDFKCEDALSKQVCDKIHAIADLLKVKYEDIVKKMKEIIAEGKTTAKAIFEAIKKFFFPDHALMIDNAIACEDVLSAKACTELRTIAKALKVKVAEIDAIIRKLVKEKITDAKKIIAAVKAKLIELATNFKCTDVLSEKVCTEIKEFAAKIEIEAHKIDELIKKIVAEGVTKAKEIIKKIIEHFFPKPE